MERIVNTNLTAFTGGTLGLGRVPDRPLGFRQALARTLILLKRAKLRLRFQRAAKWLPLALFPRRSQTIAAADVVADDIDE